MNKDTFVPTDQNKYKFINLGFFRCDSIVYQNSLIDNPFISTDNKDPKTSGIDYRNLLSWGYADILSIFLFNDSNSFIEFQKIHPSNNKIYEDRYNCGLVIQPEDFNLSKMNDLPLVGISFIKFDDKLFKGIKNDCLLKVLKEYIWTIINNSINGNPEIYPVLIFSYGWEDIILLVFAKRYDFIKDLIYRIRTNLTYSNIKSYLQDDFFTRFPNARHIVTTTYTTFAAFLSQSNPSNIAEIINNLLIKIDNRDETLVKQINFQIRPGHLDWVIDRIKQLYEGTEFQFLPGRQDLSLQFKEMKAYNIFEFYFKSIWPILSSRESPIISTQTFFVLGDITRDIEQNIPCTSAIDILSLPEDKRKFIDDITKTVYLPYHSVIALGNTLVSAWHLENNYFIKGGMKSLIDFINSMQESLKTKCGRYDIAVEEILPLLSLCYIDRFRGSYPLGEGFSTPLLTSKASVQKQLNFIDHACSILFNAMRECFNARHNHIEEYYFCSTIGSITSPAVDAFNIEDFHYNLAILQIPLDSIFSPKDLYYLFHEIGHVLINHLKIDVYIGEKLFNLSKAQFFVDQNKPEFDDKIDDFIAVETLLEDILCDYILFVFGFEGDSKKLKDFMKYYDDKLTRGDVSYEMIYRTLAAERLYLYLDNETKLESEFIDITTELKSNYRYSTLATNLLCQEIKSKSILFNFLTTAKDYINTKDTNTFYTQLKKFPSFSFEDWLEIYRQGI